LSRPMKSQDRGPRRLQRMQGSGVLDFGTVALGSIGGNGGIGLGGPTGASLQHALQISIGSKSSQ
jgi:hypothetical protein